MFFVAIFNVLAAMSHRHTLKLVDPVGGFYSKKLGELLLVDSDSTRLEEHAIPLGELGAFEFWKYLPENATFFGNNVDFLATRGR